MHSRGNSGVNRGHSINSHVERNSREQASTRRGKGSNRSNPVLKILDLITNFTRLVGIMGTAAAMIHR